MSATELNWSCAARVFGYSGSVWRKKKLGVEVLVARSGVGEIGIFGLWDQSGYTTYHCEGEGDSCEDRELRMGMEREEDGTGPGEEDLDWRNFQNAKTEP